MTMKRFVLAVAMMAIGFSAACARDDASGEAPALSHVEEILAWREGRLDRLTAPQGYLNLVGLFWLEPGIYTFGSGADNDLVFPRATHESMGRFERREDEDGVRMVMSYDVDVRIGDDEGNYSDGIAGVIMPDDTSEDAMWASSGTLVWTVIKRQDMVGIRLYDTENPAAANLPPIPQYDIDEKWRVPARLRLYDEPRVANVGTVVEGLGFNPTSPGVLEFEIGGETHTLEVYESANDRFFIVFGDRTSGRETYPAGRFLYTDAPGEGDDGMTVLDFNMSYNPPCAFNDFSTCPVASPRNRLPIEVTAGEKYIDALHVGVASR